jgi:hypothetical protein
VILVIADPQDPLTNQFTAHYGGRVLRASEPELFAAPFSLEIEQAKVKGTICVQGATVALDDLSAILLRPVRSWWPGPDFVAQDQMFVYHETIASWYTVFDSVRCPVINRFGLGWWLQDHSYPMRLRAELAAILGVPASDIEQTPSAFSKLSPTGPDPEARSVYLAGRSIVSSTLVDMSIRGRMSQVREWQKRHGIPFCRLDFETGAIPRLKAVEVFPLVDREPAAFVERLAGSLMEEVR